MKNICVRLLVQQFDACFDFYSKSLGFEVAWGEKGETYASFSLDGNIQLSIYSQESMLKALDIPLVDPQDKVYPMALILETDHVGDKYNELVRRQVICLNEPHDMPGWGMRCFHLKDPDGNLIEIFEPLSLDKWNDDLKNHKDAKKYFDLEDENK